MLSRLATAVHYDASSDSGRKVPLLATARGSILSHVSPQLRFTIKGESGGPSGPSISLTACDVTGTKASFVKHGLDVQEDQLKAGAAAAVADPSFGVEPEKLAGQLYTPGNVETIKSETGSYKSWFANVAEVSLRLP